MADVRRTVEIIFQGNNQLGGAIGNVESELSGIAGEASGASEDLNRMGGELDDIGSRGVSNLKLLGAALIALGTSQLVKEFINANSAIESFEKAISFATGSAEDAAAELAFITDASDRLGLNLLSTADAYKKFFSAAGSNLSLQETREIFEAVAGTISIVGGSAEDVSGALIQLSQGVSKSKFELEDLKSISERIPGFFDKFAGSLGITTAEFLKLISAGGVGTDELLKLARVLNEDLAGADFSGFEQASNRLANSVTNLFKALGDTGAFDFVTAAVEVSADALDRGVTNIGGYQAAWEKLKKSVSGDQGLVDSFSDFEVGLAGLIASTLGFGTEVSGWLAPLDSAGDSLAEIEVTAERIPTPLERVRSSLDAIAKSSGEANKLLKEIGIDPKQIQDPIEKVVSAFDKLTQIEGVSGDDIFRGLIVTLDKISSPDYIPFIRNALGNLFSDGVLSAKEYEDAFNAVLAKNSEVLGQSKAFTTGYGEVSKSLQGTADSADKAAEAVSKTFTELEKIASNERIANLDARVTLDVAGIEADASKAVAAIENIGAAITSTGELLGSLFDNRIDADSWEERRVIEEAIRKEQESRETQLKKNNKLIDEQIKKLRAQTDALRRGDALITINGDGLQPHLEAFMFEILEALQIRVNAEGFDLLLGAN